jgi:rhomboid protease GluP
MFGRQRTGSVLCPSCGKLVGVNDDRCYHCGRRKPGMWGLTAALSRLGRRDLGFEQAVIGGSILLYLLMLAVTPNFGLGGGTGPLSLLAPSLEALVRFGASGALPLYDLGRWWTLFSAGWLHAGLLHIFFNVLWVRQLAPQTAELYGAARMVILYTVSSVAGFLLSSTAKAFLLPSIQPHITVGASAPIFGLLAALVFYGRRTGSRAIGQQAWTYAVILFIFGFLWRGVDNWAHAGGFAGGYLAAFVLDPRRPERPSHLVLALACLAATALSILASIVISPF